ncbi:hypothetical protein TNCV_4672121 [Trichonephila clavipes]|nr:hypothetical protein TNCV_4672121 [Trichonephila clavipes]
MLFSEKKKYERFQRDKSKLYGGFPKRRSGIDCLPSRKLLHQLFKLSSACHRLTPFADNSPPSTHLLQPEIILLRITPIWTSP